MENLFDILSHDERIIVLSSEENQQFYTWNQSLTLQCWGLPEENDGRGWSEWEEVETLVLVTTPANFEEARAAAQRWMYQHGRNLAANAPKDAPVG